MAAVKARVAAGRSTFIIEHTGTLTEAQEQALADAEAAGATAIWVAIDGNIAGIISLQDQIKDTSAAAIAELKNMGRSEEHTSELQSRGPLVCRLLLETNKK